jgi:beta-phosphoglucomutase
MSAPSRPRAGLLFDLDGTLAQSEDLHLAAFNAILAPTGRSIDHEAFVQHVSGRSNAAIMAFLFPELGIEERVRLAEQKEASFRQLASSGAIDVTPGAEALIAWAHGKGCATGLVTNAPRANAEAMITAMGLDHAFDTVISADELARSKPHPDPYLAAIESLQLSARHTAAIEDSVTGIAAAHAAGVGVIALANARTAEGLRGSPAALVVRDLGDPAIFSYLEQRFAGA